MGCALWLYFFPGPLLQHFHMGRPPFEGSDLGGPILHSLHPGFCLRPEKLYPTDDELLRYGQIMPDLKKIQSFQLFLYFFLRLLIIHDCVRPC